MSREDCLCCMCLYGIEWKDECLLGFKGAKDAEGEPTQDFENVSECDSFTLMED